MNYTLFVRQLTLWVTIGLYEEERRAPQKILCDLSLDLRADEVSDRIEDTLNYAELSDHLVAIASATNFKLLEPFSAFLIEEIRRFHPSVQAIDMCLTKANPMVLPQASGCGLKMSWQAVSGN